MVYLLLHYGIEGQISFNRNRIHLNGDLYLQILYRKLGMRWLPNHVYPSGVLLAACAGGNLIGLQCQWPRINHRVT